jgi:uncharacterized metal-binding protein YceD (DUF177 family)
MVYKYDVLPLHFAGLRHAAPTSTMCIATMSFPASLASLKASSRPPATARPRSSQPQRQRAASCNRSHITAAADEQEAAGGGTETAKQERHLRKKASGLRREDIPFCVARSDLTWRQPWRFEQSSLLRDLALEQQGVSALDCEAAASPELWATATFKVESPTGLGALLVTGKVSTEVPLRCESCDKEYIDSLQAVPFDAVLLLLEGSSKSAANASRQQEDLGHNELTFRVDEPLCDITSVVVDALVASLPTVCLCGGSTCQQHADRELVWSSSTSSSSSPFAAALARQQQKKAAKEQKKK